MFEESLQNLMEDFYTLCRNVQYSFNYAFSYSVIQCIFVSFLFHAYFLKYFSTKIYVFFELFSCLFSFRLIYAWKLCASTWTTFASIQKMKSFEKFANPTKHTWTGWLNSRVTIFSSARLDLRVK